jgi:GAF domain-containing protein/HAMP domain-containing protein
MSNLQPNPIKEPKAARLRGSLAGTLVRTLLIFAFIPLIVMAGAAYYRARTLLRDQVVEQSQNLLSTELENVESEIKAKEIRLDRLVHREDFGLLIELALHANIQSEEYQEIRSRFLSELRIINTTENDTPVFSQFLLLNPQGKIMAASRPEWEGLTLTDPSMLSDLPAGSRSVATINLDPLYPDQMVLATAIDYETRMGSNLGTLVGITESQTLQEILQSLQALSPSAITYFILPPDTLLTRDPYTEELSTLSPSQPQLEAVIPALDRMMGSEEAKPVALEFKATDGRDVLTQVQWLPSMRVGVALEIPQAAIYGRLNSLIPFTIFLVTATVAAMGLVLVLGTNRVIKPLRNLTQITRKFAQGDWNERATVTGRDEVGELASSFNRMADDLSGLYHSLEQKVDERTRQIRTAAEVAQSVTALPKLDDLLNKTVELLVKQFDFYQANIFIIDRAGRYAILRAGNGPAAHALLSEKYKLEVGSPSIIGWVSANNLPRLASDVLEDPIHLKNELLPETRSEVCVPIAIGRLVMGVLDVQSTHPGAFSGETVTMLQTLASQIAAAIQNVGLVEATQLNFQEMGRLYRSSRLIAEASTEAEVFQTTSQLLKDAPFPIVVLAVTEDSLEIIGLPETGGVPGNMVELNTRVKANIDGLTEYLSGGPVILRAKAPETPPALRAIVQHLGFETAAYLPVRKGKQLAVIIIIGAKTETLTNATIQPYANLADLITVTLEKTESAAEIEKRLRELESLASTNQALSTLTDLQSVFHAIHDQIKQVIGDYGFSIALYDQKADTVSIPYVYEENRTLSIESIPLGEGLTSHLIRTRQPLLIAENMDEQAIQLGAKIIGKPARSWMGVPMLVQNLPIGALIVQDLEKEHSFDEDNLRFLTALASQAAGIINNARLLEESLHRSVQLETAAEIARDISGSLNLDELLTKAVNLIRERFDFYHAAVFLLDLPGEFAVIREATGEAGAQMKRAGHKMGVGSKSIVGYVSSRGEQLIVNDTNKDATYYANPLLPETRSEAAIPLKIGERILGVLDVQSQKAYAFSGDNLRSLEILADQVAIAVVNTELFAETQEHLSQHRLLHHITTTAASGTTLEEALESAVSGLQVTLGGDRVAIMLTDRERKELEVKASIGYTEDVSRQRVPVGTGITGWVAEHRRPLRINDVTTDPRYIILSPNTRSELAIPLIYRNEVLGVLNVESEQLDAYTENDEEMLGTLGGSLAAVIANARLVEQIRVQADRERLINEVANKIRRSSDIQSILTTTASELTKITGARRTKIQISPVGGDSADPQIAPDK